MLGATLAALLVFACTLIWSVSAIGTEPYDSYEETVAGDGPVAQYRFDDGSEAGTLHDSAGSADATNNAISLESPGPFDGSLSGTFTGEAFASLSANPLLGTEAFTAEAWVNWSGGTYGEPIFAIGSSASHFLSLSPAAASSGHPLEFKIQTGTEETASVTASTLSSSAWNYIAVTETNEGTLTLYLNGAQVGQTTGAALSPASLGEATTAYLGKALDGVSPNFDGMLSNVAFYSNALSAAQIEAHYNAGEVPVPTEAPAITGTARSGETLEVSDGSWDGLAPISFAYQWERCNSSGTSCTEIGGATASSYTVTAADVANTLRASVSASNSTGSASEGSSTTDVVQPAPTPSLVYTTDFGSEGSEDGQFSSVGDVLKDGTSLWAIDFGGDRVEQFDEEGHYVSQFGAGGSGDGELQEPSAIAVDASHHLWILDRGNERVEEFTEGGEYMSQFSLAEVTEGHPAEGLAIDAHGDLWVADTGNARLDVFSPEGALLKTVGESGSGPDQIGEPEHLAIAKGRVWVTDWSNSRVDVFSEEGESLEDISSAGSGPDELEAPYGLVADDEGNIWVGELAGTPLKEFNVNGELLRQLGEQGSEPGELDLGVPTGLALGPTGDLWVADTYNSRIDEFSPGTPTAPENISPPTLSGLAEEGETLSAEDGSWSGAKPLTFEYQWERCAPGGGECEDIASATEREYALGAEDVGKAIRVHVHAENEAGSASAFSTGTSAVSGLTPPASTQPPSIEGPPFAGESLTANNGEWSGSTPIAYSYQWRRCASSGEECVNIAGANSVTYVLQEADIGAKLRVRVEASNVRGSASQTSSATALIKASTPPVNTALPSITGATKDGQTLGVDIGGWEGAPTPTDTYQWEECAASGASCRAISGADAATYTLSSADLEATLRVRVTAHNVAGSATATSSASSEVEAGPPAADEVPRIVGTPYLGATLQAETGAWDGIEALLTYQWQRCSEGHCDDIAGASASEYTLTEADLGDAIRLQIGIGNPLASVTAVSAPTTPVKASATLFDTSAPSISGAPQSGHVLTGDPGGWNGAEAIGFAYQWQRCDPTGDECADVTGATGLTYLLSAADVGSAMKLLVNAAEEFGDEAQQVALSAPVAAAGGPLADQAPRVSGPALVGSSLVATSGVWSGEGSLSYAYQWDRCSEDGTSCSAISGATTATHALEAADAGSTLRVLVTATDGESRSNLDASQPVLISPATLAAAVAPSISGTPELTRLLQAPPGIWTGPGDIELSYQWKRCNALGEACSAIAGAEESAYRPVATDAGDTLEVLVSATNGAETNTATSATTATVAEGSIAPEALTQATIGGYLTVGKTLSATPGEWVSSEAIGYEYQWLRCNEEGEECSAIEGATGASYELVEADVGTQLRVVATASNGLGSASSTSEATETVELGGPPANNEAPAIVGSARIGSPLAVENGQWSGAQPLSYAYAWQRCVIETASCSDIEGATKPSYTPSEADSGMTLRVQLTVTNEAGSAVTFTAETEPVTAPTSPSTEQAIELAEESNPSSLAASEPATLEGQTVTPELSDVGEELQGDGTLSPATASKEAPGELAVGTIDGEVDVAPLESSPDASPLPTIVNGSAAVFANSFPATNTIVRPDAVGATSIMQLRSAEAPEAFSWDVDLGVNQELEELPNGSIAVVEAGEEATEGDPLSMELPGESALESPSEESEAGVPGEAAEEELEESVGAEGALEKLAAAPQVTTAPIVAKEGELQPQDTQAQYESAQSTLGYAGEHASGAVLMVIEPPTVLDATGASVPAFLTLNEENIVTLHVPREEGAAFPLTAAVHVTGQSESAITAATHKVRYGLSDPNAPIFTGFDPKLKTAPFHPGIARDVIAYNTGQHPGQLAKLIAWLKAVKAAGLRPYITLSTLGSGAGEYCKLHAPCPAPTAAHYKNALITLINKLNEERAEEKGHHVSAIPSVQLWGAWNEPDLDHAPAHLDPLFDRPARAAQFWEIAQSVIRCKQCRVVAGEFAEVHVKYIRSYLAHIVHDHYHRSKKPHIIGFHDYQDLVHVPETLSGYTNPAARTVIAMIKHRVGHPHIWLSEQGVELQSGGGPTRLTGKGDPALYEKRQRLAAEDFLKLGGLARNVEVVDYYLYRAPTDPDEFDSALRDATSSPPHDERPAYCVLVLAKHGCASTSATKPAVPGHTTKSTGLVLADVDPHGLPTNYWVEWGVTELYGSSTSSTPTSATEGAQTEQVPVDGLEACRVYHYRSAAENEANEGTPSYGEDKTFETECEPGEAPTITLVSATVPPGAQYAGEHYERIKVSANGLETHTEERDSTKSGGPVDLPPFALETLEPFDSEVEVTDSSPSCPSPPYPRPETLPPLPAAIKVVASNAAGTAETEWIPVRREYCFPE